MVVWQVWHRLGILWVSSKLKNVSVNACDQINNNEENLISFIQNNLMGLLMLLILP